uniref:(northern house mosquito) hypothetical protein n=1 Tax=Culex pipiens TaxID=7175 RepID=A0A8D8MZE7_CULPI
MCLCSPEGFDFSHICVFVVNRTHAHTFRAFWGFLRVSERDFRFFKDVFRYKNIIILRYFTSNVTFLFSISTFKCVLVKANNVVFVLVCVRVKRCAHPRRPRLLCLRASSTFYCVCKSVRVG